MGDFKSCEYISSDSVASLEVVSLGSDVWLGTGTWETCSSTEMLLGFSVLGSSKKKSVCTY